MNGSRVGWLSLLIMVSMLSLTRLPAGAPKPAPRQEAKEEVKEDKGESGKTSPKEPVWEESARLTAAVTGESWDSFTSGKKSWKDLETLALGAGYSRVDPVIALVPCPLDSNLAADFDQALAAIQEAYADSGYLLVGWSLPWTGDATKDRLETSIPGLLVFRRFDRRDLAVVLLVGEVPALGIHRVAFQEAVDTVRSWQSGPGNRIIRILGPSLSDSAISLQLGIDKLKDKKNLTFEIVTGSATAKNLGDREWNQLGSTVSFERTIVPEDERQRRARWFVKEKMGWDLQQVALLTEADEAYGQPYLIPENARSFLLVRFPPGIAGVRNAWDRDLRPQAAADSKEAIKVPETTLDLRLGDRGRPVLVPEMSTVTWASRDLAIANLLATLATRKIRYIGILASDARDAVFLVERVRRFAPGSVVFLVDNNLLYTHPRLAETMSGTLVIGGYPLFTHDDRLASPGRQPQHYLNQFTSDLHEGTYQAMRRLILSSRGGPLPLLKPDVWISAVGNGSLWPLARLDGSKTACICPLVPWRSDPRAVETAKHLSARTGNKLLLGAVVLLVLTWILNRFAIPPRSTGQRVWWVLAAAASTLLLAVGVLVVLGTLPYRRLAAGLDLLDWKQLAAGVLLVGTAAALVGIVTGAVGLRKSTTIRLGIAAGFIVLSPVLLLGLDQALCRLWMLGGIEFFHRRAFTFSSSLSPLVSLAWLGGAFYLWALAELLRQRMQARQEVDWPASGLAGSALKDCSRDAEELKELLGWPWPRWTRLRSSWALLLPFCFCCLLVSVPIRPIAESSRYGWIFLLLLGLAFFLSIFSFCRFLAAWLVLKRILNRIALPYPPDGLNAGLTKEVGWSPMKSFGWQIPHFKMSILMADRLRSLASNGRIDWALVQFFDENLEAAITADKNNYFEAEIAARGNLRVALARVYGELAWEASTPGSERLAALRLVSYVRYIFAHLRGCLIAALVCGFPLLAAASTYAFEPNEFVSNWIWGALLTGVLITLWVFFQMDRDEVLSLISGTAPGKVQFDWHFATNILTYGVIPLLGLIASQFPQSGRYLVSLVNPLLHVVGGGG
jgi:hypothetical protein